MLLLVVLVAGVLGGRNQHGGGGQHGGGEHMKTHLFYFMAYIFSLKVKLLLKQLEDLFDSTLLWMQSKLYPNFERITHQQFELTKTDWPKL